MKACRHLKQWWGRSHYWHRGRSMDPLRSRVAPVRTVPQATSGSRRRSSGRRSGSMRRWVAAAVPPPSPGPADQRSIFHDRGLGGVPPPLRGHQDTPKCDLTPERTAPLGQACPLATQALRYLSYNKESQHQAVLDEKKAPCPAKRLSTQPLPFRCAGGLRVGVGVGCRGGGGAVPAGAAALAAAAIPTPPCAT